MITVSNSEIGTFDRCRREWYLKYYLGVAPAEPEITGNAIMGTRVHAAMEGFYGYGLDPLTVLGVLYDMTITQYPDHKDELLKEREMATIMVDGYMEYIAESGVDANLRVVAVEQELLVELYPGITLRVRMDQVVLDEQTGLLSFLDFKTAANFDKHEVICQDPQMKTYSVAQRIVARGNGAPLVDGGIIRTLRRVKRTAKSTPPYYQNDPFRYNAEQLDSAEARLTALALKIVTARFMLDRAYEDTGGNLADINGVQRGDLAPSWMPNDCTWRCPFAAGLCPAMDDGSDWPGIITGSGRFTQTDPYAYYRADPVKAVRAVLEGR